MKGRGGFTLVELIVAMAFFSFMLAILSVGFIQIAKIYQSGVASRRTQAAARGVMEDITREVRASQAIDPSVTGTNKLCLTQAGLAVYYERDADPAKLSLTKKTYSGSCGSPPSSGGTVLIGAQGANVGDNLQIRKFNNSLINDEAGNPASVEVSIQITTGAPDLFNEGGICDPVKAGVQFCATTSFTNTVSLRGGSQ